MTPRQYREEGPGGHRPGERDIDVFGLTDIGCVRDENQDQFLVASFHRAMRVLGTSLPESRMSIGESESISLLMMVADGAGGHAGGRRASELATQAIAHYVSTTAKACLKPDATFGEAFLEELETAVDQCHEAVCVQGKREPHFAGMATTLTLVSVVWPWANIIQVGDSRCYLHRGQDLQQLTTDQTLAQRLVDQGIPKEEVDGSRLNHVLSSAIGGQLSPVTTQVRLEPEDRLLLCTDGLTNHLTDREIRHVLGVGTDSEQMCHTLVDRAIEAGGTDNVTVVIGQLRPEH